MFLIYVSDIIAEKVNEETILRYDEEWRNVHAYLWHRFSKSNN